MKDWEASIAACPRNVWSGDPAHCNYCDTPLPKGCRRWCGRCESIGNHSFATGKWVALQRDGRTCQNCGASRAQIRLLDMLRGWTLNRWGLSSVPPWWIRSVPAQSAPTLEVNHIEPALGRQSEWGCHNHIDNLETLCQPCHQVVTRLQRIARHGLPKRMRRPQTQASLLEGSTP